MSQKILVVDDMPINLRLCKTILAKANYKICFAQSGEEALVRAKSEKPDLILSDVMMPNMDGFALCKALKSDPELANIPVIFVTALNEEIDETKGFDVGAVDFITKPISAARLLARVKNQLSLVQLASLEKAQRLVIQKLGLAAEYKDNETGLHIIRMSHYSQILGDAYGLSKAESELLYNAAPMHDIGKIGIPDNILSKPGKLTSSEWQTMQTHPTIGAKIIGDHDVPLLQAARIIALNHHERWDGSGYPSGLAGENIPLFGRIVAIADVFDALTSDRPYKKAWSIEETKQKLAQESGKHFDPKLVSLFLRDDVFRKVNSIYEKWAEAV